MPYKHECTRYRSAIMAEDVLHLKEGDRVNVRYINSSVAHDWYMVCPVNGSDFVVTRGNELKELA